MGQLELYWHNIVSWDQSLRRKDKYGLLVFYGQSSLLSFLCVVLNCGISVLILNCSSQVFIPRSFLFSFDFHVKVSSIDWSHASHVAFSSNQLSWLVEGFVCLENYVTAVEFSFAINISHFLKIINLKKLIFYYSSLSFLTFKFYFKKILF